MKTSFADRLKSLFSRAKDINADFFEDLTDMLVEGDIGAKTAFEIVDELERVCSSEKIREQADIIAKLYDDNLPQFILEKIPKMERDFDDIY